MTGSAPESLLVSLAPRPAPVLRLICLPYAGAGANAFFGWPTHVPETVQVEAVRLPGRETRWHELPYDDLRPIVDDLTTAVAPFLVEPAVFFGHSMGALLAFEVTRELRRRGEPLPRQLLVSGRRAPQIPNTYPPIHQLPDDELIEEISRLGATPAAVLAETELMRLVLPRLRADFAACDAYRYVAEEPLDCAIAAFGGLADPEAPIDEVAAWGEQTRGEFTLDLLPGGHFYLLDNPASFFAVLLRRLTIGRDALTR